MRATRTSLLLRVRLLKPCSDLARLVHASGRCRLPRPWMGMRRATTYRGGFCVSRAGHEERGRQANSAPSRKQRAHSHGAPLPKINTLVARSRGPSGETNHIVTTSKYRQRVRSLFKLAVYYVLSPENGRTNLLFNKNTTRKPATVHQWR